MPIYIRLDIYTVFVFTVLKNVGDIYTARYIYTVFADFAPQARNFWDIVVFY